MQHLSAPLKAIVVEDEAILQLLLEEMLSDEGIEVVGIAADVDSAVALAAATAFDFAILDAHIVGGDIEPVFEALKSRQIPMIFCTGAAPETIRAVYGDVPVLTKPYLVTDLSTAVQKIFSVRDA